MDAGLQEAASFLHERYGDRAGKPAPLGSGDWSRAYAFLLDRDERVLRLGAHGEDFAKDRVMSGVARQAGELLPVPEVLELGTTPAGWYAVSERAHGGFLDALDEDGMSRTLPSLLGSLAALAGLDCPARSGYGLWTADGDAPHRGWAAALLDVLDGPENPRVGGWRRSLARHRSGQRVFDAAAAQLRRLAPRCPDRRGIVHSDLLNRNVLVDGGRVTAVLDWGNALCGDPLYDLAWLRFWWPGYPAWAGVDLDAALAPRLAGERDAAGRMLAYELHIGLDSLAYNAFTGRTGNLEWTADRLSALL